MKGQPDKLPGGWGQLWVGSGETVVVPMLVAWVLGMPVVSENQIYNWRKPIDITVEGLSVVWIGHHPNLLLHGQDLLVSPRTARRAGNVASNASSPLKIVSSDSNDAFHPTFSI